MNRLSAGVTLFMLAVFVTMVAIAATYTEKARFMPFVVGIPGIGLCLLQLVLEFRLARRKRGAEEVGGAGAGGGRRVGEPAGRGFE